ncbi:MAG: hypothetical protein KDE34_15460, partial [Anaerolineales bacterium]|nr:hypothetical protein [Anaerolineales bacterium]
LSLQPSDHPFWPGYSPFWSGWLQVAALLVPVLLSVWALFSAPDGWPFSLSSLGEIQIIWVRPKVRTESIIGLWFARLIRQMT